MDKKMEQFYNKHDINNTNMTIREIYKKAHDEGINITYKQLNSWIIKNLICIRLHQCNEALEYSKEFNLFEE